MGKLVIKVHGGQNLLLDDGIFLRCRYKRQEADTPVSRRESAVPGSVVWRAMLNFDVDDQTLYSTSGPDLLHLEIREEAQDRLVGATALDMRDIIHEQMNVTGQSYELCDMANQSVGQVQCDIKFTLLDAKAAPLPINQLGQQMEQARIAPAVEETAPATQMVPPVQMQQQNVADDGVPFKRPLPQGFTAYCVPSAPILPPPAHTQQQRPQVAPIGQQQIPIFIQGQQPPMYAQQSQIYGQGQQSKVYGHGQKVPVMVIPQQSVMQTPPANLQSSGSFLGNMFAGVGDFLANSMANSSSTTEYYDNGYNYGSGNYHYHAGSHQSFGHHSSFGRPGFMHTGGHLHGSTFAGNHSHFHHTMHHHHHGRH